MPETIMSDQGRQFISQKFQDFTAKYNIKQEFSSPRHPQSNGFIESQVKIIKNTMLRCDEGGEDVYITMLILRSTPLKSCQKSPAELLAQCKFRALLPI